MTSEIKAADERRQALLARLHRRTGSTGHEVIARELRRVGITHVYTIPGVPIDETLVACHVAGLKIVSTRHQQAAVMAAGAHNWIAGGLKAAVLVTSGPGITNCTTGIIVALDNGWPLIVIGGRRDLLFDDRGGFQVLDGESLMRTVTRSSLCVRTTNELAPAIAAMAASSLRNRPGPCYADVPTGALQGRETVSLGPAQDCADSVPVPSPEAWIRALVLAKRPLLLLGNDLRFGTGFNLAADLIQKLGIPWATTVAMRGLADEKHPLCATAAVHTMLAECDFVLSLGATFDWTLRHAAMLQPSARIVRIGHGSDPVVIERAGGIDIDGDPSAALAGLLGELESKPAAVVADRDWLQRPLGLQSAFMEGRRAASVDTTTPITPALAVQITQTAFAGSCRYILDGNISLAWADRMLDVSRPLGRITPGINGCMGTGIPFALGSCMAEPATPVVVITGDFALGVSLQDLETLVRLEAAVTVVLLCNGGNTGSLRQRQFWPNENPDRITRFTQGTRYDRVMIDLGGRGTCVDSADGLEAALQEATVTNGPFLIQVNVRDDVSFPDF